MPKMQVLPPHKTKSREVKESDLDRVYEDAQEMFELLFKPHGRYDQGGVAIAHAQVDEVEPLRFFVTRDGGVIVNPVMTNHTKHPVDRYEGCLSFPTKPMAKVQRWNKVTVTYRELEMNEDNEVRLSKQITANLSGKGAQMFTHELGHMECLTIY